MKQSELLSTIDEAGVFRAGRWILNDVSVTLRSGEIVTLIGPNGAGKSTTAKLVLGVLRPDKGTAWRRPGLRIAYVPQRLAIDWTLPLSVRHFMDLTGRISGHEARQALAETEVAHLENSQMQTLSGGEFQRVLLARAIARKPELLVLDEPVQGVDFAGEAALYDLIRRIRDRHGCGILLISHNLHLVMAATDRVVCLNGHVCCSGTPKTVTESAEYKALFGARATSALAFYEHKHDHVHLPDGRVQCADHTVSNDTHAHVRDTADETYG